MQGFFEEFTTQGLTEQPFRYSLYWLSETFLETKQPLVYVGFLVMMSTIVKNCLWHREEFLRNAFFIMMSL